MPAGPLQISLAHVDSISDIANTLSTEVLNNLFIDIYTAI